MLTATILAISLRQEPNALDAAIAASNAAIKTAPAVACSYRVRTEKAGEKPVDLIFRHWHDGKKDRSELEINGDIQYKKVTDGVKITMIVPPQKSYSEGAFDAGATPGEPAKAPVEANSFAFSFGDEAQLRFESNPPFRIVNETKAQEGGQEVRVLQFETKKPDGSGEIQGVARFDSDSKTLLGVTMEISGQQSGKLTIQRLSYERKPPAASVFQVDPSEYAGFEKKPFPWE